MKRKTFVTKVGLVTKILQCKRNEMNRKWGLPYNIICM